MADIIRIKGSTTTATPTTLAARELAYSEDSGNLFIGRISDGTPVKIGGKTDVDKLAGIAAGATANASDADLRDRATHTGTQLASTISDFASAVLARLQAESIGDLSDVDLAGAANGQVLVYRSGTFEMEAPPSGVTTFIALTDTPANFTSANGFIAKVNAAGNAIEFVDGVDGGTF
jgi:hypothetical protein